MRRIAICVAEDEGSKKRALALERGIALWAMGAGEDVMIKRFAGGVQMFPTIEMEGMPELYFLDLENERADGFQIALKIRETDFTSGIVFLSNGGEHERAAYRVHPFQFLSEPLEYECLAEIMDDYVRMRGQDIENFVCVVKKMRYNIRLKDIQYFYSECRHVTAVCRERNYSFYGRLNEVQSKVEEKSGCFLRIHQSYLVNVHYIKEYSYDKVLMANGEALSVSRDKRKRVKEVHALMEG